jgi:predicted nucleic acid-binding protein
MVSEDDPAVDPDSLPERALLDTGVLIRALGDRPEDPLAPACRAVFAALLTHRKHVLIAAPSLAEMLRGSTKTRPPRVRGVTVVPFDQDAACILGERLPQNELKEFSTQAGVKLTYYKYDALIVACAARHRADCIIALEFKIPSLAEKVGLVAKAPATFLAKQIEIPFAKK